MQYELLIEGAPNAINMELLNEQISALGIVGFDGIVIRGEQLIALFLARPRPADIAKVQQAGKVHDHTVLTTEQQNEKADMDVVDEKRLKVLAARAPRTPAQIDDTLDAIIAILRRNRLL